MLADAVSKALLGGSPQAGTMAVIGLLALAANSVCLVLLTRHRADDVNMRSAWVCSRNDLAANGGVLLAAALVAFSGSHWPDVIVGSAIAGLFVYSAIGVLRDSRRSFSAGA